LAKKTIITKIITMKHSLTDNQRYGNDFMAFRKRKEVAKKMRKGSEAKKAKLTIPSHGKDEGEHMMSKDGINRA